MENEIALAGITDLQEAQDAAARTNSDRGELSTEDFYGLLSAELQYQDPTDPSDANFLDQILGLQTYETSLKTAEAIEGFNRNASFNEAANVIGKVVTLPSGESGLANAVVRDEDGNVTVKIKESLLGITAADTINKDVKIFDGAVIREGTVTNVVFKDNEVYLSLTTGNNDSEDFLFEGLLEVTSSIPLDEVVKIENPIDISASDDESDDEEAAN